MGVRLAIDDFGTGYSSLTVLRDLPIRELKIDRSFISGLVNNSADERLVRSTIGLAHDFDVIAVAEGVEDEATLNRLAELGCDHAQGYYFSRPVGLDALIQWFEAPSLAAAARTALNPSELRSHAWHRSHRRIHPEAHPGGAWSGAARRRACRCVRRELQGRLVEPRQHHHRGHRRLVNDKDGTATLTVVSLVPGHSASAVANLTNSGDVDADLSLSAGTVTNTPASPALSAKLDLDVADLGDPACSVACPPPVTIYSGKLGAFTTTSPLIRLAPLETHRVRFTVSFPDGGVGADNAYQLAQTSLGMTWKLAQR